MDAALLELCNLHSPLPDKDRMTYSIITIARTLGAGGEGLGRLLAGELGMRYVDGEIIEGAAARAGITAPEMARAEGRKGLIQRILDGFALSGGGSDAPSTTALAGAKGYEQLIVDVIRETAAAGNAVIVAHGAAIPLADVAGTLRVLVTAPYEVRVARLATNGLGEVAARRNIDESDAARADFLERFFDLDHEEPTHYDLVVNTDRLSVDQAARAILSMAR